MDRPQPFFTGLHSALSPRKYMFCAWFCKSHIMIISVFYDKSTQIILIYLCPLLLKWINFNPSMD